MSDEKKVAGGRNDEFSAAKEYAAFDVIEAEHYQFPRKIEKSDIKPHHIRVGETEIVAQRHGAYIRDKDDPNKGSLPPESAIAEKEAARNYFEGFLSQLPESERSSVDVLIVASDTQYFDGGKRSYETATLAQEAAIEAFSAAGLSEDHIINTSGRLKGEGGPRPMPQLREPNMLNKSPDFLDYMLGKYGGINLDFWIAFEGDHEKETRLAMGAEGPDDIADRMGFSLKALARYSQAYHQTNPDRRLIIWAATHYDTISPFVKRDVFGVDKDEQLQVDYGAGITVDVDKEGNATTEIAGKIYPVMLKRTT